MKEVKPNEPLLTSNMIPVYYDESDNNWKKADSSNNNNAYKWYDYGNKMWANAVTVAEESSYGTGVYVYNQKISSNSTVSLKNTSTSSYEEVVTESYEYTVDNSKSYLYCGRKLDMYNGVYINWDMLCTTTLGSGISIDGGYYVVDPDDKSSQYLPKSLKSNDGTNSVFVTTKYSIKENKVYDKKYVASSFSFDKATGKYTLSNPELVVYSSSYINYYTCDSTTGSSCTTMYKLKTMTEGSVSVADKYTSVREEVKKSNSKLTLPDGSTKACTNNVCTREDYIGAPNGTAIPMADINTMFVWIPRYKYTYMNEKCSNLTNPSEDTNPECYVYVYDDSYHDELLNELVNDYGMETTEAEATITSWKNGEEDYYFEEQFSGYILDYSSLEIPGTFMKDNIVSISPQEIKVEFESGTASTGTIKCVDTIGSKNSDNNSISQTCTDSTNGSLTAGTSTYTHPAFTFGDEELTGIWVGKFENSGGNNITIKPDVQSTRSINISTMFKNARNMELANNIYGFSQNGTTLNTYTGEISGDSNNLDTYMMKNMEWGAATYLSHSKYGMNGEVFINNSSSYYTGRSGGNVGGATPINGTYTDQTSTTKYNTYGFYTYDGYLLNYNTNNKSTTRDLSKVASTTGNIYGIYDMSGGSLEYVMGNQQDSSNAFSPSSAGTWSATNKPLDKYYDKYSYGTSETEYARGKLGDATKEIRLSNYETWYSDSAFFLSSDFPWFTRGGSYSSGSNIGLFFFSNLDGGSNSLYGSRVVLSILSQ